MGVGGNGMKKTVAWAIVRKKGAVITSENERFNTFSDEEAALRFFDGFAATWKKTYHVIKVTIEEAG